MLGAVTVLQGTCDMQAAHFLPLGPACWRLLLHGYDPGGPFGFLDF